MKLQIKSFIAIAILSGVIATGCSGNKRTVPMSQKAQL